MTQQREALKLRPLPFLEHCPVCQKNAPAVWVLDGEGTALDGARFDSCAACAPETARVVAWYISRLLSGGVPLNNDFNGK